MSTDKSNGEIETTDDPAKEGLFHSVLQRVRNGWNRKSVDSIRRAESISTWWSLCLIGFVLIVYFIAHLLFVAYPTSLYIKDEVDHPHRFIAERARQHLKAFTDMGPKVTGSYQNEVIAVNMIKDIVSVINASRNAAHEIEIDVQKASGQFFLEFKPYGMMSAYNGIQNVVVKLKPAGRVAEHSLMVNSHFDSVPVSTGAGDPIALVAVMLESLRVISKSPTAFKHNIIFLFNGAEENLLQGSHAFITQHKWAKEVRAFVNLDSAGNGGKEIMFQAGPKHPWLIKYYKKTAKYPFAAVMGEELFQANIIPSDTDFRVFRDFGKIPGMDFAYSKNGFVYHTKYDTYNIHPIGTLQNTGDNIMELIKALGNADELENVEEHEDGKLVFFDFMTWFIVYYTQGIAALINSLVFVASLVIMAVSMFFIAKDTGLSKRAVLKEFGLSTIVQTVSLGFGIGLTILMAVIVDGIGRSLSWFSNPWLVVGLYFSPLYCGLAFGPMLYIKYRKRTIIPLAKHVQLFLHAQCLIMLVVLLALTAFTVRSAYIALFSIIFYSFSVIVNTIIEHFQKKGMAWIFVHLICQIFPLMYYAELSSFSFTTFMPMQGRGGPGANPELLIGLFCILYGLLLGGFMVPLFGICRKPEWIVAGFFSVTILALILCSTPIGFPYTSETNPQRYWIFHTDRVLHSNNATTRSQDSGFFMLAMDRHSPDRARDHVDKLSESVSIADECDREIFCGMPFYTSRMHKQAEHSHWVPGGSNNLEMPKMTHVSTDVISGRVQRFTFVFSGPDHMGIYFSPYAGIKLINWSVDNEIPDKVGPTYNDRKTYFIFYSYGLDIEDRDYKLTLDFEYPLSYNNGPTLEIALTSHYTHHDEQQTVEFQNFIKSFPKWTHVTPWMSTYENWII